MGQTSTSRASMFVWSRVTSSRSGNFNTKSKAFDFQGKAENIQLARLAALANRPGMPSVTGIADFTAHVSGNLSDEDFSNYQITFDGQGRDVTINGRPAGTVALVRQNREPTTQHHVHDRHSWTTASRRCTDQSCESGAGCQVSKQLSRMPI